MKPSYIYTIFIISVTLLLTSCDEKGHKIDAAMDKAESIMNTHPDSALHLLQEIDTTGLQKARMARFALLLTKAENKNYIISNNDSLIINAVNYYKGRNDSNEIQSLYYYGDILYNSNQNRDALVSLHAANDLALSKQNWFYAGMSARLLADLYKNECLFNEELKYALDSKNYFKKFESERRDTTCRYSRWVDLDITEAYVNGNNPSKALHTISHADTFLMKYDRYFREMMLINKAQAYKKTGCHSKAIAVYNQLITEGAILKSYNWNRLAESLIATNQIAAAKSALDSAMNCIETNKQDSVYFPLIECQIASNENNHEKALSLYKKYVDAVIGSTNKSISETPFPYITQTYKTNLETEKIKRKYRDNIILLMSVTILLLIAISTAALMIARYRSNMQKLENKILRTNEQILLAKEREAKACEEASKLREKALAEKVNHLMTEYEILAKNLKIASAGKNDKSEDLKAMRKIIKTRFETLDSTCKILYMAPSHLMSNKTLSEPTESYFQYLRSEKTLEYYDDIIEAYSNGWMDKIKSTYPTMRASRLRLIRYLYIGLSSESIAFLMNKSSKKLIDTDKSRLKTSLLKNTNNEFVVKILKKLNLKE